MAVNNGTRLADNVDLSVGFVDVVINVPAGTYQLAVFRNASDPALLVESDDFQLIDASQLPSQTFSSSSSQSSASTTRTSPSSSTLNASADAAQSPSSSATNAIITSKHSMPVGAIVGIVLGCIVLILVLLLVVLFLRRKRRQRPQTLFYDNENMVEAPQPLGLGSTIFSQTGRSRPSIEPYTTLPSQTSLSTSARAQERQQRINTEVRLLRKQMEDLRQSGAIDSVSPTTHSTSMSPSPASAVSTSPGGSSVDTIASHLEQSRLLNDRLQSRIVDLESQLQSAWARGLSDEPPPGYVA
ncbi:hypothetical protein C8F01DRAFT_1125136 [Mycena amicta]|nr:hypothetical protein C8F01DRAFT_1125136 [Mycena amicta]